MHAHTFMSHDGICPLIIIEIQLHKKNLLQCVINHDFKTNTNHLLSFSGRLKHKVDILHCKKNPLYHWPSQQNLVHVVITRSYSPKAFTTTVFPRWSLSLQKLMKFWEILQYHYQKNLNQETQTLWAMGIRIQETLTS